MRFGLTTVGGRGGGEEVVVVWMAGVNDGGMEVV